MFSLGEYILGVIARWLGRWTKTCHSGSVYVLKKQFIDYYHRDIIDPIKIDFIKAYNCRDKWPKVGVLPVRKLPMLDIREEIRNIECEYQRFNSSKPPQPTKQRTDFLVEIGTITRGQQLQKVNQKVSRHSLISSIIQPIVSNMEDFNRWSVTSTNPRDTYETVKNKIDKAPREDHQHFERMWQCYRAIAAYLLRKYPKGLQRRTDAEIIESFNKKGTFGWQEKDLEKEHSSMKEYIEDRESWKPRVESFKNDLLNGKTKFSVFSLYPKEEVKEFKEGLEKPKVRFIWTLSVTPRIYQNQLFGNLDKLLKKLPYSVCGESHYNYGDMLNEIFLKIPSARAVCDDVSGWDTKVSYSILCLEAEFLQLLTKDEQYRKEMVAMYCLYAYPLTRIERPSHSIGGNEWVICRQQGQVASGRIVTYSMNTITNIVVTMCRAAYSQGVNENDMYSWALDKLNKGHSTEYGGKISGDDSVIVMRKENAIKFATKGANFMNDIGMPRKNTLPNAPSVIHNLMEEVQFCSHRYSLVEFKRKGSPKKVKKWMPRRSEAEILAKAVIIKNEYINDDDLSWAREKGLYLIVNYIHMPIIRLVALAILSATPNDLNYDHLPKKITKKPWIQPGSNVIDIINNCLFGFKTVGRNSHCLSSLDKLADAKLLGVEKSIGTNSLHYNRLRDMLISRVLDLRIPYRQYDDLVPDWPQPIQTQMDKNTYVQHSMVRSSESSLPFFIFMFMGIVTWLYYLFRMLFKY